MTALASDGFHAVALDMPPFGYSQRPDPPSYDDQSQARRILGALAALHLTKVILVGHSLGARPTVEAALIAPGRVRTLVLVDAALDLHIPPAESLPSTSAVAMLLKPGSIRNALVATTLTNPLFTKRLLELLIARKDAATPARVRMLQQPFIVGGTTEAFGRWLVPFATMRERSLSTDPARVHTLAMPTLVIWGENDSITPLSRGQELAHLLPNASLLVLPGMGHIPAIENPELFNAALVGFLSRPQATISP
jgi:pimeloyl-ACP methyl ester carboxylesterase